MIAKADWQSVKAQWNAYRCALKEDPLIGVLKEFRDRLFCDLQFNRAFNDHPRNILESEYGVLTVSDITIFLTQQQQDKFGASVESSERAKLLRSTLDIDQLQRDQIKRLHPVHAGWDVWRQLQIARYQKEDPSPRGVQITHIPFAIELTQGCSGACSFCGLSASQLSDNGPDIKAIQDVFRRLLKELHSYSGALGQFGVLYWASDPLDHRHYEAYAGMFADEFGIWPATTTALAETQVDRVRQIIHSNAIERPWGLRCSLRSASAYRKLCQGLTSDERALLRLLPQYKQSLSTQAIAGRAFKPETSARQLEAGGTIACMSGLLISLPLHNIKLITPCRAEPLNPNGYRTLISTQAQTVSELGDVVKRVLANLPCPVIKLEHVLRVNIDRSQFSLYHSPQFPDLLSYLEVQPASILDLCTHVSLEGNPQELISYCLWLMQVGAVCAD